MVYGAITIGGLTRLTESGLSMVNWDIFKTMKPPFTQMEWEKEFSKYRKFPEYQFKNSDGEMTLADFKFIWTMEYLHRMWGRAIGIVFLLPCAYFWRRGYFNGPMKLRMVFSGLLIASQGLVGWWMVKSGLDPSNNSNSDVPRVSHYRLATHLSLAFILYGIFLWNGLSHLFTPNNHSKSPAIKKFRGMVHGNKLMIFMTIIIGAFVAGLDAGLVYNSWPKYADRWIPEGVLSHTPSWKNFIENPATVQFLHRNMAYLTLILATLTWIKGIRTPLGFRSRLALHSLLVTAWLQLALGISTLLHHVPVSLASMHQNGALLLYSSVIWLSNELRKIPK
ncbi:hypothetical protein niasHS_013427 [Heterodera schachtii]|uniref:Uncharacterized protein n=1 Tax=Heterodera schachtii TaxID=97005 RepID=A0ABD2IX33_HETSC